MNTSDEKQSNGTNMVLAAGLIDAVKKRIQIIEDEKKMWLKLQANFKWDAYTRLNGSDTYGRYQAEESFCNKKIELLKWVLSEACR